MYLQKFYALFIFILLVNPTTFFASNTSYPNMGSSANTPIDEVCTLPAPTNVTTTNTTPSDISLVWDPVAGAASYNVDVFLLGALVWTENTGGAAAITVSGLSACTKYDFEIAAVCPIGGAGALAYHAATTQCLIIDDLMASFNSTNVESWREVTCNDRFQSSSRPVLFKIETTQTFSTSPEDHFEVFEALTAVPSGQEFSMLHVKHDNPDGNTEDYIFANEWRYFPRFMNSVFAAYVDIYYGKEGTGKEFIANPSDLAYIGLLQLQKFSGKDGNVFSICPFNMDKDYKIMVNERSVQRSSKEDISMAEINLTPNPFNDELLLNVGNTTTQKTVFQLFDLAGRAVLSQVLDAATSGTIAISTLDLKAGAYIARYQNNETIKTFKIIKVQ